MITVLILLHIFGIYSLYTVYNICKEKQVLFNILEGKYIIAVGSVIGIILISLDFINFCFAYLP